MKNYLIEKMKKEHVPEVAAIERQCFSLPWSEEGIKSETDNPSAEFFVIKNEEEVAGYMGVHIVLDEAYVTNVAVLPCFRGKGMGEALVTYGEERAKKRGCSFISLEVRVSNEAAIALYEKSGFIRVGERKDFYSSPKENALIMTKYFDNED